MDESTMQKQTGVYIHRFKTPYKYREKTYEELTFSFVSLTGRDIMNIEMEMAANEQYMISPEFSHAFQSHLAARAAGVACDMIECMQAADFLKITNEARSFLLDTAY